MTGVQVRALDIEGAYEFTPPVYRDARGLFTTPYHEETFIEAVGRPLFQVRDVSHNLSARGVLRGIHYTIAPPGRAKYVYCPAGRVQDYLVDLRLGSPTFGQSVVTELSEDNSRALYLPVGIGHTFMSLVDDSVVVYLLSEGYTPANELSVSPLDPALGLTWPSDIEPVVSERDRSAPTLAGAKAAGMLPDFTVCQEIEAKL